MASTLFPTVRWLSTNFAMLEKEADTEQELQDAYDELISAHKNVGEVNQEIGSDSLAFLSKEALLQAGGRSELCLACYTGHYPTALYRSVTEANKED